MTDERWDELLDLTAALLEGELTEEGAERLATWLSIDDEAQDVYANALAVHAALTLEFQDKPCERIAGIRDALGSRTNSVLPSAVSGPPAESCSLLPQPNRVAKHGSKRAIQFCRQLTSLSGNVILASCALMLAVVAVYGSERLIVEVLSARRASTADQTGGMIVSQFGEQQNLLMQRPNEDNGTRRIGSSKHDGVALASVYLFPLPPMRELEQLESAKIEWTYKRKDGDPKFSVDLYGLGFVKPDSPRHFDFWEGAADDSTSAADLAPGSAAKKATLLKRGVMTPQTPLGRISIENRKLVRFLQSLYDEGAQEGDLAVFRLNANSRTSQIERESGYAVVHPPSISDVSSQDELPVLSVTAKSQMYTGDPQLAKAVMATHSISEHWSGGVIRSFNNLVQSGCNSDGTRRIGSSVADGVGLVNVFTFSLPAVERLDEVVSAQLQWTLASKDNSPDFSVDLYGLGYVRAEAYHGPCFWEGNRDLASPTDYGLQGPFNEPVVLIARRVMRPNTPCGRVVIDNQLLVAFLRSLYQAGAQEGDLVVFRLNADVQTLNIARGTGFSVVHAPEIPRHTTEADLPVLLMTLN